MPSVRTDTLEIHYLEYGESDGWPVVLSHGFPYSPEVYEEVTPILIKKGARVIIPYLRGYGKTKFLSSNTLRTGQQAALACDLAGLLEALSLKQTILAGFDWGGLASCTATALFPERVAGLVCYGGYDVLDIEANKRPSAPNLEKTLWYQYLFQTERGRSSLKLHRATISRMLWSEWSPGWSIPEEKHKQTLPALENEDFVDVVISHYRHAMGNLQTVDMYEVYEKRLAEKPPIIVPAITVDGLQDPLKPGGTANLCHGRFNGPHEHWSLDIGHSFPLEAPADFARAVLRVHSWGQETFEEKALSKSEA